MSSRGSKHVLRVHCIFDQFDQGSLIFFTISSISQLNVLSMKCPRTSFQMPSPDPKDIQFAMQSRRKAGNPCKIRIYSVLHLFYSKYWFCFCVRCCSLPGQGVFLPSFCLWVLLANGSDGGGCCEHGGGSVLRQHTEERSGVWSPDRFTL